MVNSYMKNNEIINNSKELKMTKKKLRDFERIEMLWDYILSLDFDGEVTMDRNDEGYEIQFTWKDWSKK